ncbi:MAG: WbuC family cupin fold metalloprotein [Sedimentisphaerales bacterium]|nr:WbuC family cupin fold metalloprotein [Sedimentisphaerales bacterium]
MTQATYFDKPDIIQITPALLEQLKQSAACEPLRRARLCLHRNLHDKVHEMVIALQKDSYCRPHRHLEKSESFHIIEGSMLVILFDDQGLITKKIKMAPLPENATFFYRLNCSLWHMVLPLTEFVIFHETTTGPFIPDQQYRAPWSPDESDPPAVADFLNKIIAQL